MDFHSLTRRELQCLCKKNKIPANLTNIAMADSLTALQHVEGLEEFMNPSESGVLQSPARVSASIPANGTRTSARRKPTREVEISQPLTQARVTRRTAVKRGEENKDVNVPKTPAIPSSRRRAPVDSACRSLESQMEEGEEEGKSVDQEKKGVSKTPSAMASSLKRAPEAATASVQRAYSTRRSVKFLETTMSELSLNEGENSKIVMIDLTEDEDQDLDGSSKDNSEVVPDMVLEADKDSNGSDMHTLEETENNSVLDETQDKSEVCLPDIPEKDEKVAEEVHVTEFSSEPNTVEEEAADTGSNMDTLEETENISVLDEIQDKNEGCLLDIPDETVAEEVPVTEFSSEANTVEEAADAGSNMDTLEETENISVLDETQDKNESCLLDIPDETVAEEVPVTEFSSEANDVEEEVAEVSDGIPAIELSLHQQTKDLVKAESVESNQLAQGENSFEVCRDEEVPVAEFSSEANDVEEEVAEVLDGIPAIELSLHQQTKDLVKAESVESNQLAQGENSFEVCGDDEQYELEAETEHVDEVKDSGIKVACENSSDELEHSLDFPDDMQDSDIESDCTSDEVKEGHGSKVECEKSSGELEHSLDFPDDMEDSDIESECTSDEVKDVHVGKVENQNPFDEEVKNDMPDEKQTEEANKAPEEMEGSNSETINDGLFDAENNDMSDEKQSEEANKAPEEMEGSDSETINDGLFDAEADVSEKNKSPICDQAPEQTSHAVEVDVMEEAVSVPTVSSSVKLSGYNPVTAETPLKPLVDDASSLAYQFPRPTKSSCKKQATTQKMVLFTTDDKENAENNSRKAEDFNSFSLRELKKRVKALTLNQNGGQKKSAMAQVGKTREPLQSLPENNQMRAVAEQETN